MADPQLCRWRQGAGGHVPLAAAGPLPSHMHFSLQPASDDSIGAWGSIGMPRPQARTPGRHRPAVPLQSAVFQSASGSVGWQNGAEQGFIMIVRS